MVYFIHFCKAFCFVFTNWDVIVFGCRVFCVTVCVCFFVFFFLTFGQILKSVIDIKYLMHVVKRNWLDRGGIF